MKRKLTGAQYEKLIVARRTLIMSDEYIDVMGGMTRLEAETIMEKYTDNERITRGLTMTRLNLLLSRLAGDMCILPGVLMECTDTRQAICEYLKPDSLIGYEELLNIINSNA